MIKDKPNNEILTLLDKIISVISALKSSNSVAHNVYKSYWEGKYMEDPNLKLCNLIPYKILDWTSAFHSLNSLILNRDILQTLYDLTGDKVYQFEDHEYELATRFTDYISQALKVIEIFSSKDMNCSLYLPLLEYLMIEWFKKLSDLTKFEKIAGEKSIEFLKTHYSNVKEDPYLIIGANFTYYPDFTMNFSSKQKDIQSKYLREFYKTHAISGQGPEGKAQLEIQFAKIDKVIEKLHESNKCRKDIGITLLDIKRSIFTRAQELGINEDNPIYELLKVEYVLKDQSNFFYYIKQTPHGFINLYYNNEEFAKEYPIFTKLMRKILIVQMTSKTSKKFFPLSERKYSSFQNWQDVKNHSCLIQLRSIISSDNGLPFSDANYYGYSLPIDG